MVKDDLTQGLWVLFSGTPCQVAGLTSYIPDSLKERLLTIDIVCHGVPSPAIWKDYVKYLEANEKKVVIGVDFRDKKRFGWNAQIETFTLADPISNSISTKSTTSYKYLFCQNIMLRPSCGECKYCNLRRPGDLTLGDFWGWEKTDKDINADDKGISLVLVNTLKGKIVFDQKKGLFNSITPHLKDCIQQNLKIPTTLNPQYVRFQTDYESHGFYFVLKKYGDIGWKYKLMNFAEKLTRKIKRLIQ